MSGEFYPTKKIELINETELTVEAPRDSHFSDYEDNGVAELYQVYAYLPKEDSEPTAYVTLGIAAEIDCDLSPGNVKKSWEIFYGAAEYFEEKETATGIFNHRAEFRNKKVHKISYFLKQEEDLILECTMEVKQPGKRKKLDERLMEIFDGFVWKCRF